MSTTGVVGLGVYLPGDPVGVDAVTSEPLSLLANNPLLRPPRHRRHVPRRMRAAAMIECAARAMFDELGREPAADLVLTNVLLPDLPITGAGAEAAARLGLAPRTILDVHNGGCGSFPFMLDTARQLLSADGSRTALVCNVQNTAGTVFSQPGVRDRRHAVASGDGCGVALVQRDAGATLLATAVHHDPAFAADMDFELDDGRLYWEPGRSELDIRFEPTRIEEIRERGNNAIPRIVRAACHAAGVQVEHIDVLITNQPNRVFLRNWREELGLAAERHIDTFDELGNLYGAAAPITLAHAARGGRLHGGALVVVAGFAHAGDFSAATALRWRGGVVAAEVGGALAGMSALRGAPLAGSQAVGAPGDGFDRSSRR